MWKRVITYSCLKKYIVNKNMTMITNQKGIRQLTF